MDMQRAIGGQHNIGNVFLFVVAVFSLVMLYLMFWPVEIVKPRVQPYKVDKQFVSNDASASAELRHIVYFADVCKFRDVEAIVNRSIVIDGVSYDLESEKTRLKVGCSITPISIFIPESLPNGRAYINIDTAYEWSVFQPPKPYHLRTEEFDIR